MTFRIPYIDFGGEGAVLHFAHPNAYPPTCFRHFLAPLADHYQVLGIVHRPLWPESAPEALTDWQLIADDLIHFLDQEGLQRVIGVGHSLGAVATMLAANARPDLFSQLVLIDPVFVSPQLLALAAAHPDQAHLQPMVQGALNRRTRWADKQAAFDRFRGKRVFERFDDHALWAYVDNALGESESGEATLLFPREWEARFYALPPQQVWAEIPKIRQPTLGLRAEFSDALFPEAWQLWQRLQPAATFQEMAGVGHMLTMEQPQRVADVMLDWLQGRPPANAAQAGL